MNALRCPSDLIQRDIDTQADKELQTERDAADLDDMAESKYWLRKWHREDDSNETVWTSCELGLLLMLCDGLPCGDSERADDQREQFDALHKRLRECFDAWASAGKHSHLDHYIEQQRLAREADASEEV
jgi:hypothetical protein